MELSVLAASLHNILLPASLLYLLAGTLCGYAVGVLPGIGPVTGIAILLPLTYYVPPIDALIFFASLYQSAEYGGSITAIAVSAPGTPNAAATILDGYAMNRNGQIGKAFGYSLWSAVFASLVGILGMLFLARPMAKLALLFGPSAYADLGLLGLSAVSTLSSEYPLAGLLSAALGLLLSTVGLDLISGIPRFTFGQATLFNGVPLVPLLIGIFALPEAVTMLGRRRTAGEGKAKAQRVWLRWPEFRGAFRGTAIGTVVGFLMGLIPGLAGSVPPWISYYLAKSTSRDPSRFGKGAPEGITAPEATNAAVMHSTLIPTFSFGIPGTPTSAVILGAMMISGLTPGPLLFQQHPDIPFTVIISLLFATAFLFVIGLVATNLWVRMLNLPYEVLAIAIFLFVVVGSYVDRSSIFDVEFAIGAGVLGYFMNRFGFSIPALILGVILGPIVEGNARRALLLSGGHYGIFVSNPLNAALLVLSAGMIVLGLWQSVRKRKQTEPPVPE